MKKEKVIIMMDSPEAAQIKTVTGWVSREGRFFGDDERAARFNGGTHHLCECGEIMERHYTKCQICRNKKMVEKYESFPFEEWDQKVPVAIWGTDDYFWNVDDVEYYLEDNGLQPEDLQLVICYPNHPDELNAEQWYEYLPEDSDGQLPKEMEKKIAEFNEFLKTMGPLSWNQRNVRTEYKR